MRRSTGPRNTASLSNSVDEHLNMYALAAGAAGVGMLAMAQPAAAKIIYTRAHINIGFDQAIPLDLNHDGIADFELGEGYGDSSNGGISALGCTRRGRAQTPSWGTLAMAIEERMRAPFAQALVSERAEPFPRETVPWPL